MEYDLPEGFELVSKPDTSKVTEDSTTQFDLPEGFDIVSVPEVGKEPMSTLMNPVKESNPFLAGRDTTTSEPMLNLTKDSNQLPKLSQAEMDAEEAGRLKSKYENMYSKASTTAKSIQGYLGNEEARAEAKTEVKFLKDNLLKELKNQGIDARYNEDDNLVVVKDGQEIEADSTILQDIWNAKAEYAGGVSGAIYGARAGGTIGAMSGPVGAAIGSVAGGVIGGATGAMLGKGADIAMNQLSIIEKIDEDLVYQQMYEAGIVDVVGGVIGTGVVKVGSLVGKPIKHIYNRIVDGNIDGAYDFAMQHFNLTDAQAREIVQGIQAKLGIAKGTAQDLTKEDVLKTLTLTQAGGEAIVKSTDIFDPVASARVANQVFTRAKELKAASSELSTDNIHQIVNKNLDRYIKNVEDYYVAVKTAGKDFTEGFTFDYEKTGLQPILNDIGTKIEDPRIAQGYANLMERIGDASSGRTFEDLVDLRQLVNEVKFNSGNLSRVHTEKLDLIKDSIDKEITNAAETYIPNSKEWLNSWANAKSSYSEMKSLQKNVLFKALTRPGISNDQVAKSLSKYIGANTDNLTGINVFNQVMDKLPKNVRSRVDGVVLDTLVEKYSIGTIGGNRAVHFPTLAQEIGKISWRNSSPKVQQLTRTINKMSEIFKNDVNLAQVSGQINIPKRQSYLTTDPIVRLKFELASSMFNYVKQLAPGEKANALALLDNTSKFLENPLSSKTVKDLYSKLPKDRRLFREKLAFDELRNKMANEYLLRKQKLAELQGTDNIVPRLVWKQPKQAPTTNLPSGETLYGTARGTVSTSATKAIMNDRSDDLIATFVQEQIIRDGVTHRIGVQDAAGIYDKMVTKIHSHLSEQRLTNIGNSVRNKMIVDDAVANQKMVAKTIEAEANLLINKINKDFGVKLPKAEADKIVRMVFKEFMEKCNGM